MFMWLRLLKMLRMFMWLTLLWVCGLAGLRTLLATGLRWSPAAGGVSIASPWLVGLIRISSIAKITLSLCAWISWRARVVCRVVGERGLKVRNKPGCSSIVIEVRNKMDFHSASFSAPSRLTLHG